MDKPICSNDMCEDSDYMIASHYLIQKFIDSEFNQFFVFFRDPSEVDDFFGDFSAQKCLNNDELFCNFQAVRHWHKNRFECLIPLFFEVVVFEQLEPSKRLFLVSGKLPHISG